MLEGYMVRKRLGTPVLKDWTTLRRRCVIWVVFFHFVPICHDRLRVMYWSTRLCFII